MQDGTINFTVTQSAYGSYEALGGNAKDTVYYYVTAPTAQNGTSFTYDGTTKTPNYTTSSYYTLTGTTSAINAGSYTAYASLNKTTYRWSETTSSTKKTLSWTIEKANPTLTITLTQSGNTIYVSASSNSSGTKSYKWSLERWNGSGIISNRNINICVSNLYSRL